MSLDYLKKGLQHSLKSIKEHPALFVLIFMLQVVFIVSFLVLTVSYQVKLLDNAKGVIEPLQNANYDAESIQEGTSFSNDFFSVFESYNEMIKNIRNYALWLAFFFLFFNGSIWVLTHLLLQRKISPDLKPAWFLDSWAKYIVSSIVFFLPPLVLCYYFLVFLLRMDISMGSFLLAVKILSCSLVLLYYFLLAAFASAGQESWKDFVKMFFKCSIRKIPKSLLVFLINLLLMALALLLVYLSMAYEKSLALLLGSGLLLVLVVVVTRIFWVSCLEVLSWSEE